MTEPTSQTIRLEKTPFEQFRGWLEIVAIVAAGFWGFYTFIYQERIKPANESPSATLRVQMTNVRTTPSVDFVDAQYTVQNTSKSDIDIVADAINVYGSRIDFKRRPPKDDVQPNQISVDRRVPLAGQTLIVGSGILHDGARNGHIGYRAIMRPGDTLPFHLLVRVPHGRFDQLDASVIVYIDKSPVKTGTHDFVFRRDPDGTVQLRSKDLPSIEFGSSLAL